MTGSFAVCLGFLRDLEGHAVASLRGRVLPDHARSCAACRSRLDSAARQVRLLSRLAPAVPDELRGEAFLEGVYDRAIAARSAADGPVMELVAAGLRPVAAPEDLDWPAEALGGPQRRAMIRAPRPGATAALWTRVRRAVADEIAARRTARRRFRIRAVLVAASIVVGAWFATNWGTSKPPDIVFERLVDMPAVDLSPTAVLRRAQGD